jgi:hypothetical protein
MFRHAITTALLAALAALAACGGGGSSPADGGPAGGGGTAAGVAFGEITAFGSVRVNGVRYTTDDAGFRLDDDTVGQADLKLGMVARVEADGSRAVVVAVHSALKGPVEAVAADGTLTVMGQTVRVDAATRFEDGSRPAVGDFVDVHGLPAGGGVIAASYVERKATPSSPPYAVTGYVESQSAGTVTIGALAVDIAGAVATDMPGGSWVGLLVRAKGPACAGTPVCSRLTADRIEPAGTASVASAAAAEIEGFVRSVGSSRFDLGGTMVSWGADTAFANGTAADIVVGAKLEAEGAISGGVLVASRISLRDNVRLEADVVAVDGDRLALAGLPGVSVQIAAASELDGGAPVVGQHVEVRGRQASGGVVVAARVKATGADSRVVLRGPAAAVADPTVTVLGVAVDTRGIADGEFRQHDASIGRAAFFGALRAGDAVKFRGDLAGAGVAWDEAELED